MIGGTPAVSRSVRMRKEQLSGDDIFVIHQFLTPEECAEFIAVSEAGGYGDAPITTGAGPIIYKELRNNDRVMIDDPAKAAMLFERVRPFLPDAMSEWEPCGLNERFRYYRYARGQKFDWHCDGEYHRDNGEESKLTFMIYLNGGIAGGETMFHLHEGRVSDADADLRVMPWTGKALLFRHELLHTGAMVLDGVKYVLRTDVMFRMRT
jgi:predicted 2-oxoglutarate/Fe(II)-dependent dioxygenase YbiX